MYTIHKKWWINYAFSDTGRKIGGVEFQCALCLKFYHAECVNVHLGYVFIKDLNLKLCISFFCLRHVPFFIVKFCIDRKNNKFIPHKLLIYTFFYGFLLIQFVESTFKI